MLLNPFIREMQLFFFHFHLVIRRKGTQARQIFLGFFVVLFSFSIIRGGEKSWKHLFSFKSLTFHATLSTPPLLPTTDCKVSDFFLGCSVQKNRNEKRLGI